MIDLGFLTWSQQWEYWLFSRILRPAEFIAVWRWDYLFVPDQVWLLIGAYRAVKALASTPGSFGTRLMSLGGLMRTDPILFLSFGLMFVAAPIMRQRRAIIEVGAELEALELDADDIDDIVIAEEEERNGGLNERYANEIENAQQGNVTVLPASVLNSCRNCRNDRKVATNLIVKCGHFPFCDDCVSKEGFTCNICTGKGIKTSPSHAIGMTSSELAKPPTIVQLSDHVTVNKSCGVCQEREGLLTLMPCGHLLFCGPCVLSFKMKCPFCRERITRAIRSFDVRHAELNSR